MAPKALSPQQRHQSADVLLSWQTLTGDIPWFPGAHSDPWNLVEAAMALASAGQVDAAAAAYDFLANHQLTEGAWFNYYRAGRVASPRLDTNVVAYFATGVSHYLEATGDIDRVRGWWPHVERAINWVLRQQQHDGSISWSLDGAGRRAPGALLTGSSSIYHSLGRAIVLAERLDVFEEAWPRAQRALGDCLRQSPSSFLDKSHFSMDWYYPILVGVYSGDHARQKLHDGEPFVVNGYGVRCVRPNSWYTVAETAETAMAYAVAGERERAREILSWTLRYRRHDGAYWTGVVFPQRRTFPMNEVTSYSVAAVLLADDVLRGGPTAAIFPVAS